MSTFDQIIPELREILSGYADFVQRIAPIYVNRDLNGRVRLIVSAAYETDQVS